MCGGVVVDRRRAAVALEGEGSLNIADGAEDDNSEEEYENEDDGGNDDGDNDDGDNDGSGGCSGDNIYNNTKSTLSGALSGAGDGINKLISNTLGID